MLRPNPHAQERRQAISRSQIRCLIAWTQSTHIKKFDTTPFLVLPICLKCNRVYPHDPTQRVMRFMCPRCYLGLYLPDSTPPEPKPQCRGRVSTYKLSLLQPLAQIKAFLTLRVSRVLKLTLRRWPTTGQGGRRRVVKKGLRLLAL